MEGERTYRVIDVAPDDVLNIRAGPSMGHPIVGVIPPRGRGVRLVGHCQGWCPVSYNGATGWVNGRYLATEPAAVPVARDQSQEEPPAAPRAYRSAAIDQRARKRERLPAYWRVTGVAEGESLKVREGPSKGATVVHAFEPQSGCIRLAGTCQKPWCQVAFPGLNGDRVGWVDSKNLAPSAETCSR